MSNASGHTGGAEEVPLLPIQQRLLEFPEALLKHLVLFPIIFEVSLSIAPEAIEQILEAVAEQHEALRYRFEQTSAGWRQRIGARERPLRHLDFTDVPSGEELKTVMGRLYEDAHTTGSVSQKELWRTCLVERGADRPPWLVTSSHHLIGDLWSELVIARDMARACDRFVRDGQVGLPPPTTRLKVWADALAEMGASGAFDSEVPFWCEKVEPEDPIRWRSGPDVSWRYASFDLDVAQTQHLLFEMTKSTGMPVDDLLFAGTSLALSRWSGAKDVALSWAESGRRDLPKGFDLSRTVGPMVRERARWLSVARGARLTDLLPEVREQSERARHRGLGFEVLTYFGHDPRLRERLRAHPSWNVRVNFVGDLHRQADVAERPGLRRVRIPFYPPFLNDDTPGNLVINLGVVYGEYLTGQVSLRSSSASDAKSLASELKQALTLSA